MSFYPMPVRGSTESLDEPGRDECVSDGFGRLEKGSLAVDGKLG